MIIAVKDNGNSISTIKDYVLNNGLVVRVRTRHEDSAYASVLDVTGSEEREFAHSGTGSRVVRTRDVAVRCALAELVADVCVWHKGDERNRLIAAITEVMDFIG